MRLHIFVPLLTRGGYVSLFVKRTDGGNGTFTFLLYHCITLMLLLLQRLSNPHIEGKVQSGCHRSHLMRGPGGRGVLD